MKTKPKTLNEYLFWNKLRHDNKMDAWRLGLLKDPEVLEKVFEIEEEIVNREVEEIKELYNQRRNNKC